MRPVGDDSTPSAGAAVQARWKRRSWPAALFSLLVFAASAGYVAWTFQWRAVASALGRIDLWMAAAGGGATFIVYWMLRTLRWHVLLRRTGTHVPLFDLYMCTAVSLAFALFTPLQSGEMLKVELLKKNGLIQRSPGYGAFLVERALDMLALAAIGSMGLVTTFRLVPAASGFWFLGGLALVAVGGLAALWKWEPSGRLHRVLVHARQSVGDARTLALVVVITAVSWAAVGINWQVFLHASGIEPGFGRTMALMSMVTVASILSMVPGGIGVSEAGTSGLLTHLGCSPAIAQAGALVLRSGSLVAIVLGAGHWALWKSVRRRWPNRPPGEPTSPRTVRAEGAAPLARHRPNS